MWCLREREQAKFWVFSLDQEFADLTFEGVFTRVETFTHQSGIAHWQIFPRIRRTGNKPWCQKVVRFASVKIGREGCFLCESCAVDGSVLALQ